MGRRDEKPKVVVTKHIGKKRRKVNNPLRTVVPAACTASKACKQNCAHREDGHLCAATYHACERVASDHVGAVCIPTRKGDRR